MPVKKQIGNYLGFLALLIVFQSGSLISQNLGNITHNWSKAAFSDTTGGKCIGTAITRDLNNNLYVVGTFSGVADFDPSPSVFKMTSVTLSDDIFFAKYSPTGNFIWAKQIGGTGTKGAGGITIDNSGYIYLCGSFNGTTDFDPSVVMNALTSTSNTDDGFIAKYDLNGNLIYVNRIGSSGAESVSSIAINQGGNVYITGGFQGTGDFDPSASVFNLTATAANDIYFAKYTSGGNLLFAKNIGGISNEAGTSIITGKNSAIHITGYFTGVVDFDPSTAVATRTSISSSQDIFIAKYDSTGNYIYGKSMGGAGTEQSYSIKVDTSGGSYICGFFQGSADFNPAAAVNNLFTSNSQAGFVAKYNILGNYVYANQISSGFASTNYAAINALAIDKNKSVYVTGYLVTMPPSSISTSSIVITKFDSVGVNVYYKLLNGFHVANGGGIAVDTSGKCFVTGSYNLQLDADPSTAVYNLYAPCNDAIVTSYDASGNMIFAHTIGTYYETGYIIPSKTRRDAVGNSYVIGTIKGSYNFNSSVKLISSFSSSLGAGYSPTDIYFAKYDNLGNLLWANIIGGPSIDQGFSIACNKSGAVYITGTFQGVIDVDPSLAVYTLSALYNASDAFIARYDQNGNFVFAKQISGTDATFAFSMETDDSSNVYISGDFRGTTDFDPSSTTVAITGYGFSSNPQYDCYFAKYDSLGNYQYVRRVGDTGNDGNTFMSIDPTGAIYITGLFSGTVDFDIGAGIYQLYSSIGGGNFFAKYSPTGNLIYAKNIPVSLITSNKIDKHGNFYLAGNFYGTPDLDPSPATATLSSPTFNSAFFAKYDINGNYIMAKGFVTQSNNEVFIDVDTLSSIYISGTFNNTVDFDPSPAVVNLTSQGSKEGFLAKFTPSGNYAYVKSFGSTVDDRCMPVLVSKDGSDILLAGIFTRTVDFDPSSAIAALNSNTVVGLFVANYSSCMFPVNQTPVSALNYCESGSTTLTVQGVGAINWYATATSTLSLASGSVYVTPLLSAGNYSYYIEGSTCTSGRAQITVTVNPTPTITINSGFVCIGNSYTLIPGGAQTYTFIGSQAIVTPTINSSYSVTGTSVFGCVSTNTAVANLTVVALPTIVAIDDSLCYGQSLTLQVTGATSYTYSGGSAIVSPTVTTSYSITGTDQYGCIASNTAIANVFVKPSPVLSIANGTICSGNSFTLNPSGAVSYSYPLGGPIVSPTINTNYQVTGTGTNSCPSTASVSVTVNPLPVISVNNASICIGDSFTLSPSGATSYSITGNSFVVSPSTNSTYSVTGTNSLGCISLNPVVSAITVYSLPVISAPNGSVCLGETYSIQPFGAVSYTYSSGSSTVSPVNTSTFSVTGTNGFGCVASVPAILTVSVNALPAIIVSGTTICNSESFTINPIGAQSYTYSNGGPVVSPSVTTIYTITGQALNSCTNSVQLSVIVNPTPTITVNSGSVCSGNVFAIIPSGASIYTISGGSFSVSPTSSTIYAITGSSLGCESNSVIASVTVLSLPVISSNSGIICSGQSFTINPSGASSYTFSSGTAIVSPTISSSYSITGTNGSGCNSLAPAITTVTVLPLPVITITSNMGDTICTGESATLTANGAGSYTWSSGGIDTVEVITPTSTTIYTVTGVGSNGCTASSFIVQNVDACLGIASNDPKFSSKINIYPNPNNGEFVIKINSLSERTFLEIYNSLGQIIYSEKITDNDQKINISELANGVYHINIYQSDILIKSEKIIKQ